VTYAFSLYAQGRTTEGLEILQKLPPEALHESHAAVYAAVLLLDVNQTDGAKEYIQVAKRGPIYAEESVSSTMSLRKSPAFHLTQLHRRRHLQHHPQHRHLRLRRRLRSRPVRDA